MNGSTTTTTSMNIKDNNSEINKSNNSSTRKSIETNSQNIKSMKKESVHDKHLTGSTVMIRRAKTLDVDILHHIIQTCYRSNASWTNENDLVSGERISKQELIQLIEEGKDILFTAIDKHECKSVHEGDHVENVNSTIDKSLGHDRIIGCIKIELSMYHADDLPPNSAMFGLLAVDPDFQSKGIGSQLMNHAQLFVKNELKIPKGIIWVINHRSDIQKWYKKLGFEFKGQTKDFVFQDKAKLDDTCFLVYEKNFF